MGQKVVIVNEKDEKIGLEDREIAHEGEGILHRAIAILLFDKEGKILLAKRSQEKKLWPGFWDASCCTHPLDGEDYIKAGERRLPEELGIECNNLEYLTKFQYQAKYKDVGSENELCALLVGRCENEIKFNLNPKEVEEIRWISPEDLKKEIEESPDEFTPWLKIAFREYLKLKK